VGSSRIQEKTWQTKDKLEIVNKDIQRMGLTWEGVEASAQDRLGVSIRPYASAMLDESSQVIHIHCVTITVSK